MIINMTLNDENKLNYTSSNAHLMAFSEFGPVSISVFDENIIDLWCMTEHVLKRLHFSGNRNFGLELKRKHLGLIRVFSVRFIGSYGPKTLSDGPRRLLVPERAAICDCVNP